VTVSQPAGEPVLLRRLVPGDWPALRELRLAALAEAPYAFASTLERELAFDEQQWRALIRQAANVGAWAPELAGLAAGFPEADRPGAAPGWHLVSMWVSPRLRGQGVAADLVTAVCELARADGAGQIALWVTEVNDRARAFYRRAGFRETGERALVRPEQPGHWERRMVRDLRRPAPGAAGGWRAGG
jgi:ribosomal protein S18 acetylase RimI-like enzyme